MLVFKSRCASTYRTTVTGSWSAPRMHRNLGMACAVCETGHSATAGGTTIGLTAYPMPRSVRGGCSFRSRGNAVLRKETFHARPAVRGGGFVIDFAVVGMEAV